MDPIKPSQFRSGRVAGADCQNDLNFDFQGGTRIPQRIGWKLHHGRKESQLRPRSHITPIRRRKVHPRAVIVWLGKIQLNAVVREATLARVKNELRRVSRRIEVASTTSLGSIKAGTIGPEVFVVYAEQKWEDDQVLELARKHDAEYTVSDIEGMWDETEATSPSIRARTGVNIRRGNSKKSLSFVELENFEFLLERHLPAVPPSLRSQTMKDTGIDVGDLILHELGHAMNADHSDRGLMQEQIIKDATTGELHYSELSIQRMRQFLDSL